MTLLTPPIQLVIDISPCIGCRECVHGCAREALRFVRTTLTRDSDRCDFCLNCVEICPALAHSIREAPAHK